MRNAIVSLLFVSLIGSSLPTSGQVFKCVDETTGKMTFTDVACPDKGTGDYVPVKPANVDSGYASGNELEQSRRERETRQAQEQANVDKWVGLAKAQDRAERAAAYERKADLLDKKLEWEKDVTKQIGLRKQAKAERSAGAAASQGNAEAEKRYKNAADHYGKIANSKGLDEAITHSVRGNNERDLGRAAQGLPPTVQQPSVPEPPSISSVPEPPPIIVNPDRAGAWDTNNNRYTKGAGNTYHRSDGKTCQKLNTGMQCN